MDEKLTPEGERWARAHTFDSIVARLALDGLGWPAAHLALAIQAVNDAAARELRERRSYDEGATAGLEMVMREAQTVRTFDWVAVQGYLAGTLASRSPFTEGLRRGIALACQLRSDAMHRTIAMRSEA